MADLTLERIAELRDDAECDKQNGWHVMLTADVVLSLLDAAERGLTGDRKAAAFDLLAAMEEVEIRRVANSYRVAVWVRLNDMSCSHSSSPTLLEAIEQLPEVNHESK